MHLHHNPLILTSAFPHGLDAISFPQVSILYASMMCYTSLLWIWMVLTHVFTPSIFVLKPPRNGPPAPFVSLLNNSVTRSPWIEENASPLIYWHQIHFLVNHEMQDVYLFPSNVSWCDCRSSISHSSDDWMRTQDSAFLSLPANVGVNQLHKTFHEMLIFSKFSHFS